MEHHTSIIGLAQLSFWFLLCVAPALRLPVSKAVYYDAAGLQRPTGRRRYTSHNDSTMSEAVRTMMRMDAEVAQEAAAQGDAGFLWISGIRDAEYGDRGRSW